ncbi:RING-H2 finger protein ATL70-like [Telopea speciosissima]|uniref:RING-H2 finger protein ATL70-like n=1 Tax=Telopea speciosissima TaxID=54955 RepID=UPI001CC5F1D1|nr:RING-H2 finger protein ATL70-like [Telopea speciosissima]
MNSTDVAASGGMFSSSSMGGFSYGIGVSIGIILLITTITLTSYFCTRNPFSEAEAQEGHTELSDQQHSITIEEGFDEATLRSFPKVLYSQAKLRKDTTASCCSICLADYKGTDMLRLLPYCGHLFHVKCVDPWLRLHPTCPVCRNSPAPTPLTTPLAEVAPLSSRPG